MQVLLGLLQVAAVVEPAQLVTAIVVGLAGQLVERVPQVVQVAALPDRPGVAVGLRRVRVGRRTAARALVQDVRPDVRGRHGRPAAASEAVTWPLVYRAL